MLNDLKKLAQALKSQVKFDKVNHKDNDKIILKGTINTTNLFDDTPYKFTLKATHDFSENSMSPKAKEILGTSFSNYLSNPRGNNKIIQALNARVFRNVPHFLLNGNEIDPENHGRSKGRDITAMIIPDTKVPLVTRASISHRKLLNDIQLLIKNGNDLINTLLYDNGSYVGFYKNTMTGKYYPIYKGYEPVPGHPHNHYAESPYYVSDTAQIDAMDLVTHQFDDGSTTPTIRVDSTAPHTYFFFDDYE